MSQAPYYGRSRSSRGCLIRLAPILIGLLFIGFYAMRGCQEGPFGRKQIVGMDTQQEMALGAQAFQQVLQESKVVQSGPAVDVVRRLANELIAASRDPAVLEHFKIKARDFEWDARVVDSKEANAFCLPGGKIVVYTGLMPIAETDSALAAVMGHEIAHALASHGAERMAQEQMIQIGTSSVAGSFGDLSIEQQRALMGILGAGAKFGIAMPFSRKHETEADHMGLILMARAGHHPKNAILLWQRMAEHSKGAPPEFMSTHPGHETRIRDLEGWQDEAMKFYNMAETKHPERPLPIRGAERNPFEGDFRSRERSDAVTPTPPAPNERPGQAKGVPDKAKQVLNVIRQTGQAPRGYKGGDHFGNFERRLPQRDQQGRAIKYQEWDVNPLREGVSRGAERLVTGSDGSAYYTADHYETFTRIP